jgi:hypothetical protein
MAQCWNSRCKARGDGAAAASDAWGGARRRFLMKLAWLLALSLTVLPFLSLPVQSVAHGDAGASDVDLGGIYACEGMRPDGVGYRGTVRIIRHNGTYDLLWSVGDEEQEQYLGVGILTDHVLSVSYFGGTTGLAVYRIEQDAKGQQLIGTWTVPQADGKVAAETLRRLSKELGASQPRPLPEPRPARVLPFWHLRPA